MDRRGREIAVEQRHVDRAYERLAELREETAAMLRDAYRQADVGTFGSLVDRDVMVYRTELRARALDAADDGLVFGRLDLSEDDEVRYIGRLGVRTIERDSLVIDWRAPAAEAFYRATPEDPRGVVRRRVLHCRGHRVVDIEDDLLDADAGANLTVVGDGAFLAALARTRDGTMRDIVATIQREQDEVIRASADATVIVRGGPGTGKTAVALHRVAYLLFRHRQRFGGRGVLVIGPNPRFTRYIERVLPSLGEGGAVLRSLGDLVEGASASYHDSYELAQVKGEAAMTRVLRRAVADTPPGAPEELTVTYRGTVVRIEAKRLRTLRREVHRRRREANGARAFAASRLLDAVWERLTALGTDDARPLNRAEVDADVRDQTAFTAFLSAWWPLRRPADVLATLADRARLARAAGRDIEAARVAALADGWATELPRGRYSYADIALLDELDVLLGRPPRPRRRPSDGDDPSVVEGYDIFTGEDLTSEDGAVELNEVTTYTQRLERSRRVDAEDDDAGPRPEYNHIVVDEAQDLSPLQWRMLGRRGPHATWTIVEDAAQSARADLEASTAARDTALGARRREEYELSANYRNPAEIAAVAARVLSRAVPGARPAAAVRPGGHPPAVHRVAGDTELAAAVSRAVEEDAARVDGTIAVIAAPGRASSLAGAAGERVQVLEALDAKGLEFDAVVIAAPEEIVAAAPTGERTLYVALTRATQRLAVITADDAWAGLLSPVAEPVS
ncbi:MAG TPA: ATP-binding domain-containing protein [Streptosporangiaceae bacterium]